SKPSKSSQHANNIRFAIQLSLLDFSAFVRYSPCDLVALLTSFPISYVCFGFVLDFLYLNSVDYGYCGYLFLWTFLLTNVAIAQFYSSAGLFLLLAMQT
ncbi:MAG: hypothetical protein ACI86M_000661, partial [Saprospiraceae bacterium]